MAGRAVGRKHDDGCSCWWLERIYKVLVEIKNKPAGCGTDAAVLAKLDAIHAMEVKQMASIDDVLASVAELDDINDSLDAVFAQLQELINQGKTDPAKLEEALSIVNTQKERTKAAIVANTPAAPAEG